MINEVMCRLVGWSLMSLFSTNMAISETISYVSVIKLSYVLVIKLTMQIRYMRI